MASKSSSKRSVQGGHDRQRGKDQRRRADGGLGASNKRDCGNGGGHATGANSIIRNPRTWGEEGVRTESAEERDAPVGGVDTTKPSAIFVPSGPRPWTMSVAVPGSIIAKYCTISTVPSQSQTSEYRDPCMLFRSSLAEACRLQSKSSALIRPWSCPLR